MSKLDSMIEGREKLEKLLDKFSGSSLEKFPPPLPEDFPESLVWFVSKVSQIAESLKKISSNQSQKRVLIYFFDLEDMARVISSPNCASIFETSFIRFCHITPEENFDPGAYRRAYALKAGEEPRDTKIMVDMDALEIGGENLFKQFEYAHNLLSMGLGKSGSIAWSIEDNLLGFRNLVRNFESILLSQDIGAWAKKGAGKTAVILGAGPSVKRQMDWLVKNRSQLFILAADTMVKPLAAQGLAADLVCSLERTSAIVDLLDAGDITKDSILICSGLADPKCHQVFKGDKRVYYQGIEFEKFIPFRRTAISTGHSCVGVAMALGSLFAFEKVLLMGVDLCWSPEGDSHMKDVSYLSDESYKKFNNQLWKDSIALKNIEGKEVRTNRYWMLFKQQFEGWAHLMKIKLNSQIFNLSPSGLALQNTVGISLLEAEKLLRESDSKELKEVSFRNTMPRFKREDLEQRLMEWQRRNELLKDRLSGWIKDARSSSEVLADMKRDENFPTVLKSILGPVFDLEDRMSGEVRSQDLRVSLNQLRDALAEGEESAAKVQKNLFSTSYFVA